MSRRVRSSSHAAFAARAAAWRTRRCAAPLAVAANAILEPAETTEDELDVSDERPKRVCNDARATGGRARPIIGVEHVVRCKVEHRHVRLW